MRYSESTSPVADADGVKPVAFRPLPALFAAVLLILIKLYRLIFSPAQVFLFGPWSGCRFTPTCSQYAAEAIRRHGALAGSVLALKRICRCHPLGGCGHDPVPKAATMHLRQSRDREALLISNG